MNRLTVVCLFAHPDDESFVCGGTIAALVAAGARVVLVTFTGGEASTQAGSRRLSATALKTMRKRELGRSSRILGIAKIHVLDYPDGKLDRIAPTTLLHRAAVFIKRYCPAAVFTFTPDGVTKHRDHRMISRIARAAVRRWNSSHATSRVRLCMFGFPNGARRKVGYHLATGQRYIKLDISPYVGKKLRAIAAHKSQVKTLNRFRHLTRAELRSIFRYEYVLKSGRIRSRADLKFFDRT